jgi:hypothetical protein
MNNILTPAQKRKETLRKKAEAKKVHKVKYHEKRL